MDPVQEAVNLTRQLVRLPSESSDPTLTDGECPEGKVGELLVDVFSRSGIRSHTVAVKGKRRNVVARYPGHGPRLLLVGHMDTVSGRGMQEPFGGHLRGDRIWGRGACDDKGPLAVAVSVLRWMQEQKCKSFFDIIFAASIDEECTLAGAAQLAESIDFFDLCIALEPTGLKIVSGHKGDLRLKITTVGKAVHSSMPEQGENAVEKLLEIASELAVYKEGFVNVPKCPSFGGPSFSVTSMHGGSSSNIIPDSCAMTVDLRLMPEMDPLMILKDIQSIVGPRAQIEVLFAGSGMTTDYMHPCIQRLAGTLRKCDEDPGPVRVSYATDCSELSARGPCIVWGPGDIAQAHQLEEFIEIAALAKAVLILKNFLCCP